MNDLAALAAVVVNYSDTKFIFMWQPYLAVSRGLNHILHIDDLDAISKLSLNSIFARPWNEFLYLLHSLQYLKLRHSFLND